MSLRSLILRSPGLVVFFLGKPGKENDNLIALREMNYKAVKENTAIKSSHGKASEARAKREK